jgi:DNA polymerase III epsilon subunit-like protein
MYAVTDIETTGLDPWRNEIIHFTTIMADETLTEVGRFTSGLQPMYDWGHEAERIHKISESTARSFAHPADVLAAYLNWLDSFHAPGGHHFVCHALAMGDSRALFDRQFLFSWHWLYDRRDHYYRNFPSDKVITTVQKNGHLKSNKLSAWMDHLGIANTNHHNSEFDAEVCLKILRHQVLELGWHRGQEPKGTASSGRSRTISRKSSQQQGASLNIPLPIAPELTCKTQESSRSSVKGLKVLCQ